MLARHRDAPVTYAPTGCSLDESVRVAGGLKRRKWSTPLHGATAFERGVRALRAWQIHRGAGMSVVTDDELVVGAAVAMSAPLPIGFIDVLCRVVEVVDQDDRFGFAYGTLPIHPERGEESFVLSRTEGGATFTICAVSQPIHPLARLAPPVGDFLQSLATARYLEAMKEAVS
jgi:uncharacterized protein (UPF0548 family)